jgi:hypothetical protein
MDVPDSSSQRALPCSRLRLSGFTCASRLLREQLVRHDLEWCRDSQALSELSLTASFGFSGVGDQCGALLAPLPSALKGPS